MKFVVAVVAASLTCPAFADPPWTREERPPIVVDHPVIVERERVVQEDSHNKAEAALVSAAITWAVMRAIRRHRHR